ncbi:MAG: Co2+/Mg2+ efflux protein ApaG [Bdellovibrionales bacterium]|nr:Co2+/Mg2+ efflux protein ApaG [Bdellovibrionales bacterium]
MQQVEKLEQYSEKTRGIEVTVAPVFLQQESDIDQSVYAYSYTVRIRNEGTVAVKLINRHWVVMSGGRQIADVKGEGVVGQQPILGPGEAYEYTSGTIVVDPVGSMHGTYTFHSETGEFFDVAIPSFNLLFIASDTIH